MHVLCFKVHLDHNFPRVDGLLFRIFKVGGLGAILKRFGVKLKAIWKNLGIKL